SYGLRVTQFYEGFRVEAEIMMWAVAFRCRDIRLLREGLAGEEADVCVMAGFPKGCSWPLICTRARKARWQFARRSHRKATRRSWCGTSAAGSAMIPLVVRT